MRRGTRPLAAVAFFSFLATVTCQCLKFEDWANGHHGPYTGGHYNLSYQRPIASCRTFPSPEVETKIKQMKRVISDPDLYRLFENTWPNTLDTTIGWRGYATNNSDEELAFVVTGDIYAMWLRDSANQLQSYLPILNASSSPDSLASLYRGAINLQARYILGDPYCNAFQAPEESGFPSRSSQNSDNIFPSYDYYKVFSCNWELDSLGAFLQLSVNYVEATNDFAFFGKYQWAKAIEQILETATAMMQPTYGEDGMVLSSPYTFTAPYGGTPINDGNGSPSNSGIGLVRTTHRPSDDATIYQYLIPSNMMFARFLNASVPIMSSIRGRSSLAKKMQEMADSIRAAIEEHAVFPSKKYGDIYAFEIDGYGSSNMMDDPNIPSLLSAAFMGYVDRSDKTYQNTRRKILSRDNPYYSQGTVISGVGSPHTRPGRVWPMACIMAILTSDDDAEIIMNLKQLVSTTDGFGLMHESIDSFSEKRWSRQWFAWANGLFGQMILDVEKRKPHLLKHNFQRG